MKPRAIVMFALLCAVLALPGIVHAQAEVALTGIVTDSTELVLPGVTVTALHVDSGNVFVGITDGSGQYRIGALRPGIYRITAELSGFGRVTREELELLVGQRGTLNLKLGLAGVQESVTVTGDAPLINVTQSKLGGNIDKRQMQELPLNGRNWLDLTLLAPGSRVNAQNDAPLGSFAGVFQFNLDGQQVTNSLYNSSYGQPRFSRDAIAEFEFITGRFDATQGRASAVQVNAVSKAGTNSYTGTVSGYFRDDNFIAKDFIVDRVLAYSDQQISGTFGGPFKKDRAHFFGYYEGEREPKSFTYTSPFTRFNAADVTGARIEGKAGVRGDAQLNGQTRLMVRANGWKNDLPYDPQNTGGATAHPSRANSAVLRSGQIFASLTQTMGQRKLNEIKLGVATIYSAQTPLYPDARPSVELRAYNIGAPANHPSVLTENTYSIRDDFTYLNGHHELKLGGEFLYVYNYIDSLAYGLGRLDVMGGPIPPNIQDLFPTNDPSTWNLAPLSSIARAYRQSFGQSWTRNAMPEYGLWLQDNWTVASRLTLNLGVRWDLFYNGLGNDIDFAPFRTKVGQDWYNIAPRTGLAYALPGNRTVIRGGFGTYFQPVTEHAAANHTLLASQLRYVAFPNDGRPNFAADPYNVAGGGHVPTFEEAAKLVTAALTPITVDTSHFPYSYQTSIGLERQIGTDAAVQADYVWIGSRRLESAPAGSLANLTYNPATGVNYPFTDVSRRPFPAWEVVSLRYYDGRSNYHGLQTAFTKRMSRHWQASATYTLSRTSDADRLPLLPGCQYPMSAPGVCNVPVKVTPDLGGEYGLAVGDQRHRAVFNGIWDLPYGFQASGLYFFGSGERFSTVYGGDLRSTGGSNGRLRPDGTIVARNNFVGKPLHRVDIRVQRRFRLGRTGSIDGLVEMFNLFNRANYGAYVTQEASAAYGRPVQNANVAYSPRTVQFGFRYAF